MSVVAPRTEDADKDSEAKSEDSSRERTMTKEMSGKETPSTSLQYEVKEGARERQLTEKGLAHAKESRLKKRDALSKRLRKEQESIRKLRAEKKELSTIQQVYSTWLKDYEEFLKEHDEYIALLSESEKHDDYWKYFEQRDSTLQLFKAEVEGWLTEINPNDSVSQAGSRKSVVSHRSRTSRMSALSADKTKEIQKQAELAAEMETLKEREELEQEKVRLKIKEAKLDLKARICVSEAKQRVIEECEDALSNGSRTSSRDGVSLHQQQPGCNVGADVFTPKQAYESPGLPSASGVPVYNHVTVSAPVQAKLPTAAIPDASSTSGPMDKVLSSMVKELRKPVFDIMKFNGDPIEYRRFMRQFNARVVGCSDTDDEKLYYLEQFTTGEAHKVVTGFSYLDSKVGYAAALKELEDRYGDQDVIANAFMKKALSWPTIRIDNPKSLDAFSIFLVECESAVKCINALGVMEYSENIKNIIRKLPYSLHDKWRSLVGRRKDKGETIKFHDLTTFVKTEAKKANDPTYGRAALAVGSTDKGKRDSFPNQRAKGIYATNLSNTSQSTRTSSVSSTGQYTPIKTAANRVCSICKKEYHGVDKCESFMSKSTQERINMLRVNGLCFGCLRYGHRAKECRNRATCKKCNKRHPTVLHRDEIPACRVEVAQARKEEPERSIDVPLINVTGSNPSCRTGAGDSICTMAIVPVLAKSKRSGLVIETYAFMDPGSSVSFCTNQLRKKLGLGGRKAKITLDTMGTPHVLNTHIVTGLEISDLDGKNIVALPNVYTKDVMPVSQVHIPRKQDIEDWSHLKDVNLPNIEAEIGLLIGNAVAEAYTPLEVATGPPGSPYASRTALGWIAWNVVRQREEDGHKATERAQVNRAEVMAIEELEEIQQLNRIVKRAISIDFPEQDKKDKCELSQDDRRFLQIADESMQFKTGNFEIALPFRDRNHVMPNNRSLAEQRLLSLEKKMKRSPKFHEDYTVFMEKMIDQGYAEKVQEAVLDKSEGRTWHIPHHGIYHPNKPNKIRVVFDCAAKYQGVSLNDLLLQGPDLTNSLIGVLVRFRQHEIALMSDIEGMFFQVKVPEKDRDALRFLWWEKGDLEKKPSVYRMTSHLFGATSSPSCANLALQKAAEDVGERYTPEVVAAVHRNFYVDDCLVSVDTEEKGIDLARGLRDLCAERGFRLTKWVSNSRAVVESVPVDERAPELKKLDLAHAELPNERALGVCWSAETDMLGFDIKLTDRPPTRRGLLSIISSVFDPLGLASPFVLPAKMILQELCRKGSGWDDRIDGVDLKRWQQWLDELKRLREWNMPRCYKAIGLGVIASCQLHVFSDASEKGYGMAAYMRYEDERGEVGCSLVLARSRVTPLKHVTVPRLELTAATMAVRITKMLLEKLDGVNETFYWTDSQTVLRYINNTTKRFKTFVANRVMVILDASSPSQWKYVRSCNNPADDASRGMKINDFLRNCRWTCGPEFLRKSSVEWEMSQEIPALNVIPLDDPEIKRDVHAAVASETQSVMDRLTERYSSFHKLKTIVAWLLVVKESLQRRVSFRKDTERKYEDEPDGKGKTDKIARDMKKWKCLGINRLTLAQLQAAEKAIISHEQYKYYEREIIALKTANDGLIAQAMKGSTIRKLDPIWEDNVLRVGGRLGKSALLNDAKHQILIPKESQIAQAMILDTHKELGHLGRNSVLFKLRERYWIPGAVSAIRHIVARCITCRKQHARLGEQKMAALPLERVTPDKPPFFNTGMDMFGPFEIKRGRTTLKRYGLIFTCLALRAVHLEVVHTMDTDSCLNAIRRFVARRGEVASIRTDNGTNFVGAERELRESVRSWNRTRIESWLQQRNIEWKFNPPAASHFGGVWERQIRTVRQVMRGLLAEQAVKMDDEGLSTLFCEIEMIVNSRPLTTVSSDPKDLSPITPCMLLTQRSTQALPPGIFDKKDVYARRRWRQIQYLTDLFWTRWRKEYLPTLQERQKWLNPRRNLQVGDVVLIADNTSPRNSWPLARVIEVRSDAKGVVRSCSVKTKSSVIERPIAKLCLLLEAEQSSVPKD